MTPLAAHIPAAIVAELQTGEELFQSLIASRDFVMTAPALTRDFAGVTNEARLADDFFRLMKGDVILTRTAGQSGAAIEEATAALRLAGAGGGGGGVAAELSALMRAAAGFAKFARFLGWVGLAIQIFGLYSGEDDDAERKMDEAGDEAIQRGAVEILGRLVLNAPTTHFDAEWNRRRKRKKSNKRKRRVWLSRK